MKPVTLRQVKVIDPGGPHHEKEIDIRIEKGTITKIAARIPKGMGEEIHVKLSLIHISEPTRPY